MSANPLGQGSVSDFHQKPVAPTNDRSESARLNLANTSLAGTQMDGDWGVGSDGQLRASYGLRQRFDYVLSLVGEVPLADLRAWVEREARIAVHAKAADEIMALWDRYVKLQQHGWGHAVDLQKPQTWSAALQERERTRREILTPAWAHAFYADEEQSLKSQIARLNTGLAQADHTASAQQPTNSALHPQSEQREAELRSQWQLWEERLERAKQHMLTVQKSDNLSASQKQVALEGMLNSQFQPSELPRVRALLGL